MTIKEKYEAICIQYIKQFEKKQDCKFDGWVADIIGDWAIFGDIAIMFNDIRYDIDESCKAGNIFKWSNDNLEHSPDTINYHAYTKGLRLPLK